MNDPGRIPFWYLVMFYEFGTMSNSDDYDADHQANARAVKHFPIQFEVGIDSCRFGRLPALEIFEPR
jgi:hypothetical protein